MYFLQMAGFPGSGKSTLALEICKITECIIIDHDVTKTALLKSSETNIFDHKEIGKVAYNIDFALADFYMSQGKNVILDSPCLYDEMIERGLAISRKYSAHYKYVECYLDSFEEINKRLKNRNRMISQIAEVKSIETFNMAVKNSKKPLNLNYITVNTSNSIDSYVNEVIRYITS